jgi:uncharacterized membrane protein
MIVLIVLAAAILIARGLGLAGATGLDTWQAATRAGLAVMFLFTASAHFTSMRHDLVRMVPSFVPWPRTAVWLTGLCEIAGAVGLLVPRTRAVAAWALIVFLIAVFPANVHAARTGATLGGRAATSLWLRLPMQLLFIALVAWSGLVSRP